MSRKLKDFNLNIKIDRSQQNGDLPNHVVDQIIGLISEGTLLPGDKLPSELEMTRRFQISRISLREAMKLLEARGYIESCGRQGKFVKAVTDNTLHSPIKGLIEADNKNLEHLLETIKVTGGQTAWYASTRIGEKEIIMLRKQLQEQKALSARTSPATRLEQWLIFTANLAESSRNNVLCHIHLSLCQMLSEVMQDRCLEVFGNREHYTRMYTYMEEVLDAIQSGKSDEAREIMHQKSDFFREAALSPAGISA